MPRSLFVGCVRLITGTQKHRCTSLHANQVGFRHWFGDVGHARHMVDGICCHEVRAAGNLLIAPASERVIAIEIGVPMS